MNTAGSFSLAASGSLTRTCPNGRDCPGYGDSLDEFYCCDSTVQPGDFYCCDYGTKEKTSYRGLLSEHVGEIVGGVFGALVLLLVVVLMMCFFCSCCTLYKKREKRRQISGRESITPSSRHHRHSHPYSPPPHHHHHIAYSRPWPTSLVRVEVAGSGSPTPDWDQLSDGGEMSSASCKPCGTPPPPYSVVCPGMSSSSSSAGASLLPFTERHPPTDV
ncbi:Protein shisa-4 [Trichinella pseudospiralis]